MDKLILIIAFCFILNSCKINGDLKGFTSYYKKSKSENPSLFYKPLENENYCILDTNLKSKVIIINGLVLKTCIEESKKTSLVYMWSPKCTGKFCPVLDLIQEQCNNKNIDLYVVAEYYDCNKMDKAYDLNNNIYAIDVKYYKSNFTSKYVSRFKFDLTLQKNIEHRFLMFEKGVFIKSYESFDQIN